MSQQIYTANYSVGDSVYYVIFATATIYQCTIKSMYLSDGTIFYDIIRQDNNLELRHIPEVELLSFIDAKTSLTSYLTSKLTQLNNLTA